MIFAISSYFGRLIRNQSGVFLALASLTFLTTFAAAEAIIAPDIDRLLSLAKAQPQAFPPAGKMIVAFNPPSFAEKEKISLGSIHLPMNDAYPLTFASEKGEKAIFASPQGELQILTHPGDKLGIQNIPKSHVPFWYLTYGQRSEKWDKVVLTALYSQSHDANATLKSWQDALADGYQADTLTHWSMACAAAILGDRKAFIHSLNSIGEISPPKLLKDFPHEYKHWFHMAHLMGDIALMDRINATFPKEEWLISSNALAALSDLIKQSPLPEQSPSQAADAMKRRPFLMDAPEEFAKNHKLHRLAASVQSSPPHRFNPIVMEAKMNTFNQLKLILSEPAEHIDISAEFRFPQETLNDFRVSEFSRCVEFSIHDLQPIPNNPSSSDLGRLPRKDIGSVCIDASARNFGETSSVGTGYHNTRIPRYLGQVMVVHRGPYQFHPFPYIQSDSEHFHALRIVKVGQWVEFFIDGKRAALFPTYADHNMLALSLRAIGTKVWVRSVTGNILE